MSDSRAMASGSVANVLDFLDWMELLSVDESFVDERLQSLMSRRTFSPEHLARYSNLLHYKLLLISYDKESLGEELLGELENYDEVLDFAIRLLSLADEATAANTCIIVKLALLLNKNRLESSAQHILQQTLCDLDVHSIAKINATDKNLLLFKFKVIDSVLDAAIESKLKIFLLFNEIPIENVLYSDEVDVRNHFVTKTVVKFIEAVEGINILDRIWNSVTTCDSVYEKKALMALSSLSEYYLPISDSSGAPKYKSELVQKRKFWLKILQGLKSTDSFNRRFSLYLAKRALDCISRDNKDFEVVTHNYEETLFRWKTAEAKTLEISWQNFFLLLETLEEKQGNIVQAGISLFHEISTIGKHWRDCAFELALKHPNLCVVQKSIELKLMDGLTNIDDARMLLEALNTVHMFDNSSESQQILKSLRESCCDISQFKYIFKTFATIKWLPVPLFRLTEMFADLKFNKNLHAVFDAKELTDILWQISQKPCNNTIVGEAIRSNLINFTLKNCSGNHVQSVVDTIGNIQCDYVESNKIAQDITLWIEEIVKSSKERKNEVWKIITESVSTIDIPLMYLSCKPNEIGNYVSILEDCIEKIRDVNDRPYAKKCDYEKYFIYVCTLMEKLKSYNMLQGIKTIRTLVEQNVDCLLSYMTNFITDDMFPTNQMHLYLKYGPSLFSLCAPERLREDFSKYPNIKFTNAQFVEIIESTEICELSPNGLFLIFICSKLTSILSERTKVQGSEIHGETQVGKIRNQLNEASCELVFEIVTLKNYNSSLPLQSISQFIHEMLDTAGEECLLWVLKIYNLILPKVCQDTSITELAPPMFMDRIWKELKELASKSRYKPSMKEFLAILLHKCLMKETFKELTLDYCTKIFEYGFVTNVPLYYVTNEMQRVEAARDHDPLVTILSDILLFGRGTCKDHRITDSTVKYIKDNKATFFAVDPSKCDHYFDSEIRNIALKIMLQKATPQIVDITTSNILKKILGVFQNKSRYHGNSQPHRLLFRGLQHTLLMSIVCPEGVNLDRTVAKYTHLLEKLPHQPSIRICMEILIAFNIVIQDYKLNEETLDVLKLRNIPLPSLFMIIYLVMKHRLKNYTQSVAAEYTFIMDFLLSYTMGQIFNVRLNAQYFATRLYVIGAEKSKELTEKYELIFKLINHTFRESKTEKNLIKLQRCYFANKFDVIENLTPKCIYHFVPAYSQMDCDEIMEYGDIPTIEDCQKCINESTTVNTGMSQVWVNAKKSDPPFEELVSCTQDLKEEIEVTDVSTIQKKYIPWSNMFHGEEACMINIRKNVKESGLIVVASLVDKLPNLGGLARTNEVFGVKKYVIDNLKHLEDKNFQGLSVSAEKWVNMEQVKPGHQLKEYLHRMKSEGYTIVAAEQTSSSVPLQAFTFPHNTLLLLGASFKNLFNSSDEVEAGVAPKKKKNTGAKRANSSVENHSTAARMYELFGTDSENEIPPSGQVISKIREPLPKRGNGGSGGSLKSEKLRKRPRVLDNLSSDSDTDVLPYTVDAGKPKRSGNVKRSTQPLKKRFVADPIASDEEVDDVPTSSRGKQSSSSSSLISSFARRQGNGYYRSVLDKKGEYFVELKIYVAKDIEKIKPLDRWRHAIAAIKSRMSEDEDAWKNLTRFVNCERKTFESSKKLK